MQTLRRFAPRGSGRGKVVTLINEAVAMKLDKHAHAFCFVLRSMFELSAKAYCDDHAKTPGAPSTKKPNGDDKHLVDALREIEKHLTNNNQDKAMVKLLHGSMTELGNKDGILSVISMNQLVHNPNFSVSEKHICTVFNNMFPLFEAMNR
jgi:hypothetical protein